MPNRLADQTSPYLRQHAENPVDWYPWGDEAFTQARERNVPILLSVGYSACHWCHVMAHECFEDNETAEVMNKMFVNIKVDREERPDVDAIYMDAVQAMTGRGGWPMTVFLAPDGKPFFGGTYFPKPSFIQLMNAITDAWNNRRDDINNNIEALMEALERTAKIEQHSEIADFSTFESAVTQLRANFDSSWGGFGKAPKFPSTMNLEVLLRQLLAGEDNATCQPSPRKRTKADVLSGQFPMACAVSTSTSITGCRSVVEVLMTLRISAVAVCRSSASLLSLNSRAF